MKTQKQKIDEQAVKFYKDAITQTQNLIESYEQMEDYESSSDFFDLNVNLKLQFMHKFKKAASDFIPIQQANFLKRLEHVMKQHNPPHVGELIKGLYIDPFDDVTVESLAKKIGLSSERFGMLLKGEIDLSIAVANRLSNVFGRSAESWLKIQEYYNNAQVESLNSKQVSNYLKSRFWVESIISGGSIKIWRNDRANVEVIQPVETTLKDYQQLVHDMLEVLSVFEGRPIIEIVIDMKRTDSD